jgi:asparagine synthase (glutamine-hydrolysing)
MLEDHLSGKANNARVIYTVYSFLLWYEQYFVLR